VAVEQPQPTQAISHSSEPESGADSQPTEYPEYHEFLAPQQAVEHSHQQYHGSTEKHAQHPPPEHAKCWSPNHTQYQAVSPHIVTLQTRYYPSMHVAAT